MGLEFRKYTSVTPAPIRGRLQNFETDSVATGIYIVPSSFDSQELIKNFIYPPGFRA